LEAPQRSFERFKQLLLSLSQQPREDKEMNVLTQGSNPIGRYHDLMLLGTNPDDWRIPSFEMGKFQL